MTIEDTIRIEMTRLEQLLGRLEEFKQDYERTEVCLDEKHLWYSRGFQSFEPPLGLVEQKLVCGICGLEKTKKYRFCEESTIDRWSDLREDEEE
tara:strand:- start:35787 stop:36068 length:282 start_codon:yes stop_codon:yes gene_type:complete